MPEDTRSDGVAITTITAPTELYYLREMLSKLTSGKVIGQVTWTKGTKTLDGTSQTLIAANAVRVGLIVFNRIGNAQIDVDITGGVVAANTGRSITGGNDYYFTGTNCPVGAVTIIGTSTQVVTYWEGV